MLFEALLTPGVVYSLLVSWGRELLEKYPGLSNVELEVHGDEKIKLLELKEIKVKKTNQLKNEINTLLTS